MESFASESSYNSNVENYIIKSGYNAAFRVPHMRRRQCHGALIGGVSQALPDKDGITTLTLSNLFKSSRMTASRKSKQ